ncbi:MAG: hypothetical protein WCM76_02305 [Bacteroidota bacterium]
MKTHKIIFATALMCMLSFPFLNAQSNYPKGKAKLIEFFNPAAKFTVPAGKTWYVVNIFSDCATDIIVNKNDPGTYNYNEVRIFIKSINGAVLTDIDKKKYGPVVFRGPNHERVQQMPIVLPENTIIEFIITSGDWSSTVEGSKLVRNDNLKAYLNVIETDN